MGGRSLAASLLLAAALCLGSQTADARSQTESASAAPGPQEAGGLAAAAPTAAAPASSTDKAEADLLFVQQASLAELVFDNADTSTDMARLLLHGVGTTTTWFSDKPVRRAGAFETAYFTSSETFASDGTWLGAPNAALTGTKDGQPYVVVVTLYNPIYNNKTNTLQYDASLKIDESDRHLSGGAVHFQATYAVQDLGALPYVSSGEDVFRLDNAALFIDDYWGAWPNGICLSSFVSCPNYYGWYGRGGWGGGYGGYGSGFSNYIGIRRLCPKCWEKRGADDNPDDGVPYGGPAAGPEAGAPAQAPSDGSPSPYVSPSPSPSPSSYSSPSPSPSPSSGSPSPSGSGGSWHCTGCSDASGKYACESCKWW